MTRFTNNAQDSDASPPDLEALVRQGQDRLQRILPGGGPRGVIVLVVLLLAGLGAWTAYYTVPSDSKYASRVKRSAMCPNP